jgi:hypothetical protein
MLGGVLGRKEKKNEEAFSSKNGLFLLLLEYL